jgi:hypothetical protein
MTLSTQTDGTKNKNKPANSPSFSVPHKQDPSMVKLMKLLLNWLFPVGKHSKNYQWLSHIHRIVTRINRDVSIVLHGILAAYVTKSFYSCIQTRVRQNDMLRRDSYKCFVDRISLKLDSLKTDTTYISTVFLRLGNTAHCYATLHVSLQYLNIGKWVTRLFVQNLTLGFLITHFI